MRRTTLTTDQRAALQQARHDASRPPYARDRIAMVLLSAAGWSPPRSAAHLGCHAKTVRQLLDRFPHEGLDCLVRQPPGPPPDTARRQRVEQALERLLAEDRTWTAAQLVAALQVQQITLGPRHLRRYLRGMRAGYRRTVRTLRHKQDAAKVAAARQEIATVKKGRQQANCCSPCSTNVASRPASRCVTRGRRTAVASGWRTKTRGGGG